MNFKNSLPLGFVQWALQLTSRWMPHENAPSRKALKPFACAKYILNRIFRLNLGRLSLGVARTSHGYFALIRGYLDQPVAAHSAGSSLFGTLFKVWEEYQSLRFFRPKGAHLKRYTRANHMFSEAELRNLPFQVEPRYVYTPDISQLTEALAERSGRVIVSYFEKGNSL